MSTFLELKSALAKDRKALVGLEYIEISRVLAYKCSLCRERGNLKFIIDHLHNVDHQLEFLRSDFPSVHEAIVRLKYKKQNIEELLEKLCKEVELRLGRLPPTLLTGDATFDEARRAQTEHFKEEPSSTLVIDLIMMIHATQKTVHRSRSPLRTAAFRDRSSSREQRDGQSRAQWHKNDYDTDYLLKSHRIRRQYLEFYRDLNSHPDYTDTWNKFWNENAAAYESVNKNPLGVEFTSHWKRFWDHRLAVLEEEDVLRIRVSVRRKLNLAIEPRDQKIFKRIASEQRKPLPEVGRRTTKRTSPELSSPWLAESDSWPALNSNSSPKRPSTAASPKNIKEPVKIAFKEPSPKVDRPKPLDGDDDLSLSDIVFLFKNYKDLRDIERRSLRSYMELLKTEETEKFMLIMSLTKGHGEWLKNEITK